MKRIGVNGMFKLTLRGVCAMAMGSCLGVILGGCTVTNPSRWTLNRPDSLDKVWRKTVPAVMFSDAPLPEVVERLNSILRQESKGQYSLCLTQAVANGQNVSFKATDISLGELLNVVARISHRAIVYNNRTVMLAERSGGEGRSTVEVSGYCADSMTKNPLEKFSATIAYFPDFRTQEEYRCVVTNYGNKGSFRCRIEVPAYISSVLAGKEEILTINIVSQDVAVVVSAPGYQSKLLQWPVNGTNLFYTINMKLEKGN